MMISVLIAAAAVTIGGLVLAVARTIDHDGYGSRPSPASHYDPFPTQLLR